MHIRSSTSYSIEDESISYYSEPGYWQMVYDQQPLYNYAANKLKKEQFMKSPFILYNHCYVKGVIEAGYMLRNQLEEETKKLKEYIRPVMLFIAPLEITENAQALQELKQQFIDSGIPPEEIKLKTNTIDELGDTKLSNQSCNVRYVITVHNMKENWRCPFAYIIVSLCSRADVYDMIPVFNCMLPQPYAKSFRYPLLNTGYILTASTKFEELKNALRFQLQALGVDAEQLIVKDKLIDLLKCISIFEILKGEMNYGLDGVELENSKEDIIAIVNEMTSMVMRR